MASKRNRRQSLTTGIILAIASVVLVYHLSQVWAFTVDDTFITLRYSRNIATGAGLTFNPGETPVEGYTTFLWMLVLVLPHLLAIEPVLFSKLIGLLCTLGTLFITYRLVSFTSSLGRGAFFGVGGALAVLFICANAATAVHTVSGMETALFMILLSASILYAAKWHANKSPRDGKALSVTSLLLGLTRPEGNLLALVILVCLVWMSNSDYRKRLILTTVKWYLLPGAIYFVWRAWYFGSLFPLPFYVKVSAATLFNGLFPVWMYFRHTIVPLSIPLLFGAWRLRGGLLPGVFAAVGLVLVYLFPRHLMGYEWRYVYPATIVASMLAGIGILRLLQGGDSKKPWRITLASALTFAALVRLISLSGGIITEKQAYSRGLANAHVSIGSRLGSIRAQLPVAPCLVVGDVGAIAYYSDWRVIDLQGLNDPHLARVETDNEYIMAQKPDVLILVSMDSASFMPRFYADESLYEVARAQQFEWISSSRFDDQYFLQVMTRRGSLIQQLL